VQEGEVRGVERAFHRLRPVALLQPLTDVAVRRRQHGDLELRQRLRHALARAEVCPDQLARLARRIGLDGNLAVVRRARRHIRHLDAAAFHVVFPAVVDAPDAALLVPAVEQIGAAVRTRGLDQADAPLRVAECQELLAEDFRPQRRAVGLGQLARERDRKPVATQVFAHRRAGAGARKKLVVGGRKHYARPLLNGMMDL
jgi:hypothetical protein